MERKEPGNGITRILLCPEDAPLTAPVVFSDSRSSFLSLTAFESDPRPVYRLRKNTGDSEIRRTANGEVVSSGRAGRIIFILPVRSGFPFPVRTGRSSPGSASMRTGSSITPDKRNSCISTI